MLHPSSTINTHGIMLTTRQLGQVVGTIFDSTMTTALRVEVVRFEEIWRYPSSGRPNTRWCLGKIRFPPARRRRAGGGILRHLIHTPSAARMNDSHVICLSEGRRLLSLKVAVADVGKCVVQE